MTAFRTTLSIFSLLMIGLTACGRGGGGGSAEAGAPPTNLEAAYALGLLSARSLQQLHLSAAERAEFDRGLRDYDAGRARTTMLKEMPRIQPFQMERLNFSVESERAAADEFLRAAASEPGAEKLESGIVIQTLVKGEGKSPTQSDRAIVRAEGTMPDGVLFLSSQQDDRTVPVEMLTGIPCLTESLARLTVGSKARITCPPHTGYAMQNKPMLVTPGSALRFEIELVEVKPSLPQGHGG